MLEYHSSSEQISASSRLPTEVKHSVGILGGGQLAMMLANAAHRLGLKVQVFANHASDVAIPHADSHFVASFDESETLRKFFSQVTTVVYENEWINPEILEQASQGGVARLQPQPAAMAACGNKLQQKELLVRLGIPTSRFISYLPQDPLPVEDWLQQVQQDFAEGCVLKWAKGGYDGKGTMFFPPQTGAAELPSKLVEFVRQAKKRQVQVYAEQLIKFEKELALLSVRNLSGSYQFYPLVVTEQVDGMCSNVMGPAASFGLSSEQEELARDFARRIGDDLDLRGVYAIEFFLDQQGKLLVNEIAPRVHNSGHFTLDAAACSQFENHWRAVLGWPLGNTTCHKFFGMVNIVGPAHYRGPLSAPMISQADCRMHWYEKKLSRPRRKLGHVNIKASTRKQLMQRFSEVHSQLEKWSQHWSSQTK